MEFEILRYEEGVFDLNEQFKPNPDATSIDIAVGVQPVFKYVEGKDIVGIQLTFRYSFEEQRILTYGYILNVKIDGWNEFATSKPSGDEIVEKTYDVWCAAVNYGRGVLEEKLPDNFSYELVLPTLPKELLKKNLAVKCLKNKTEED